MWRPSRPLQVALPFAAQARRTPRMGRPPKPRSVSHRAREPFDGDRAAVHVTVRMARDVPNLRSQRGFRAVEHALKAEERRGELRVTHYSVQGNHLHLVVEAGDRTVLARRMQGFSIRLAKRVNRDVMRRRRGKVLDHRYHARVLATPSAVRNAIAYVLFNHAHHVPTTDRALLDPYSSARVETHFAHEVRVPKWSPGTGPPPVSEPSLWLLRAGYRQAGRIASPFVRWGNEQTSVTRLRARSNPDCTR